MKQIKDPNISVEEACRTIAFYMGYRDAFNPCDTSFDFNHRLYKYTQDLDDLEQVWRKLGKIGFDFRYDDGDQFMYYLIDGVGDEYPRRFKKIGKTNSLMNKLVIATALAIIELEHSDTTELDISKL